MQDKAPCHSILEVCLEPYLKMQTSKWKLFAENTSFVLCPLSKKDKTCQQIILCDLTNLFSVSGFHFHLSDWLPAWHDYFSPTTLRVLTYLFLQLCVLPHSDPAAPLFGWKWYASSTFLFGWKWYASSTLQATRNDHFLDVSPHKRKNRIWCFLSGW